MKTVSKTRFGATFGVRDSSHVESGSKFSLNLLKKPEARFQNYSDSTTIDVFNESIIAQLFKRKVVFPIRISRSAIVIEF